MTTSPEPAPPTVLLEGLGLGESPRWHEGKLWFSNWVDNQVMTVDLEGRSEVITEMPGFPFCLSALPDGRMLIVSGREGILLRREPDGSLSTHADLGDLADPPWNDVVADGRGNTYVNYTGFDFPQAKFAPGGVALIEPDGSARIVAEGLAFPNGMAVTPDNRALIVAESYAGQLTAFDIDARGDLSNRRVWAAIPDSAPDGICLDADGAVWYADVPNRHCLRVAEGGEVLDIVALDRGGFSCALGGPDGSTLFIVAADWQGPQAMAAGLRTGQVLTARAPAPAAGWP